MGLYLRKSFRAGPVRINLSKSGLGMSAGVKGARIGVGPRGSYIHAGRNGLYYRQQLASTNRRRNSQADGTGCAILFMIALVLGVGILIASWLIQNPVVLAAIAAVAIALLATKAWSKYRRDQRLREYKTSLDSTFVTADTPPSNEKLAELQQLQGNLPSDTQCRRRIETIEANIYQALLDRILDDRRITRFEADTIAAADQALRIDEMTRLRIKRDIFSAAYIEAIQDREVTEEELAWLRNIVAGLGIPLSHVQRENDVVREIMKAQSLRLPLQPVAPDSISVPVQRSEQVYYQAPAQVLSKRKSKDAPSGFEYSVKRDGTAAITNKRVFVVGDGTTSVRLSEIKDLEVDIDEDVIEITKVGSGRPIVLKPVTPILAGRIIELLMESPTGNA